MELGGREALDARGVQWPLYSNCLPESEMSCRRWCVPLIEPVSLTWQAAALRYHCHAAIHQLTVQVSDRLAWVTRPK
jgi:hypothetical protein